MGQMASSGRTCHALTSSATASVTEEIRLGDRGEGAVHLFEVALDLAHRHAAGVQGDDLVIESSPVCLVLGNQLGLEGALTVAGSFDGLLAEFPFESLSAFAVTGVAAGIGYCLMAFVAQMLGQLGLQRLVD